MIPGPETTPTPRPDQTAQPAAPPRRAATMAHQPHPDAAAPPPPQVPAPPRGTPVHTLVLGLLALMLAVLVITLQLADFELSQHVLVAMVLGILAGSLAVVLVALAARRRTPPPPVPLPTPLPSAPAPAAREETASAQTTSNGSDTPV